MAYPVGYRYTKDHEWIAAEGSRARIGITDHAQSELGDIVFVELPSVGSSVSAGQILATVESVKAVGDVMAPFDGTVVEVNGALESAPETINRSPHDEGWIAVVEITEPSAIDALLDAAGYESFLAEG
jgi:glycine cleavage system H protein